MNAVSAESNQFANRFLFGGAVAAIALLNTVFLIDSPMSSRALTGGRLGLALGLLLLVIVLSWIYFRGIAHRIVRFDDAYARTKHKYEIQRTDRQRAWVTMGDKAG